MKRFLILLCLATCVLYASAQKQKTTRRSTANSIQTRKSVSKKKTTNTKRATSRSRKGSTAHVKWHATDEIKGLQKQKGEIQKEISDKQKELNKKKADVTKNLQNLVLLNTEIDQHKKSIDTIETDIKHLDGNIGILKGQLAALQEQLGDRRAKFIQSMRYMARHRSIQDKLMFIFSAKNLTQMYRRLRFVHEYAAYQRAQGELLQEKQLQVDNKHHQLETVRGTKSNLLVKNRRVHRDMENKKVEQQGVVDNLKKEEATLQNVIAERRKKQQNLNAQIDRLINIEIQKARERAAAEARARAKALAEARKKAAEERARKKAAAEAAARENARRIAEAKAREEKAKAEARAAALAAERAKQKAAAEAQANRERAQKAAAEAALAQERADQEARHAEAARVAAERKAEVERARAARVAAEDRRREETETSKLSTVDRALTGSFENNRGRLPRPLSGRIVSHYGQYTVEGLSNVHLSNSGINIKGAAGGAVHCIFKGEVSAVFGFSGTSVVMVRHGAYISVYCNLHSVSVGKGQQLGTGQTIGTVGGDGVLQFQLRKETAKLNPEAWIR